MYDSGLCHTKDELGCEASHPKAERAMNRRACHGLYSYILLITLEVFNSNPEGVMNQALT